MTNQNNRTNRRSTNPNHKKTNYRPKRRSKSNFSITDPTTIIALIAVAGLIISLKMLGILLTIFLIFGIALIIGFSMLIKKLRKTKFINNGKVFIKKYINYVKILKKLSKTSFL